MSQPQKGLSGAAQMGEPRPVPDVRRRNLVAVDSRQEDLTPFAALMPTATQAMDIAAEIIGDHRPAVIKAKGDRDMVSEIDVQIERAVRGFLHDQAPDIGFMGEEEGGTSGGDQQWVLDPIDGTANFVKGIPLYAISLALVSSGEPVLGVIDVPADGSRYMAVAGGGAYWGDERIRVRPTAELGQAIVTIGDYAVGEQAATKNQSRLAVTAQLAPRALRVRMFGSAAIDLAWLAHGRTDGAIISGGKPWDIAAGIILVREAGGTVTDALGSRHTFSATTTVATSPQLLVQILNLMGGTNANDALS
jgi:myo-inositol-1(or 4)-monophosphatase